MKRPFVVLTLAAVLSGAAALAAPAAPTPTPVVATSASVVAVPAIAPPSSSASTAPSTLAPTAAPTASAGKPLTLVEVLVSVDKHHPALAAAKQDVVVAEGEKLSAKGGFDPIWRSRATWELLGYYSSKRLDTVVTQPLPVLGASVFGGYKLGIGSFAVYDGKAQTLDLGEVRGGLVLPLWRDSAIDARRAALFTADLSPRIAEAGVAVQRLELHRAAAVRYWNWVEAGHVVTVAKDLLALSEERDVALAARVQKGDLAQIERDENQRAILARKAALVATERSFAAAGIELSLFLRDAAGKPRLPLQGELPPFPEPKALVVGTVEEEVKKAIARRPEILRLEEQKKQVGIEKDLAKNGGKPAIDFQIVAAKDFGNGPPQLVPTQLEVGLVIDIPLLARGPDGKAAQAAAKSDKVEYMLAFARDRIAADVRDALSLEETARARLALVRTELALAKKLAAAERDAFFLGQSTLLLVNLRETAVADAAAREIVALADHQRAVAVFRAVTGDLPKATP